ncbi:phage/plasmid primase, P4 family [Gramella lutea]|uniref:Phage/plasmid primase, P4 family n=1 Tax=Christiangramia lutea TaxID=1607951 RepID=A0A9X1V082_9FLAO|nr:phage/plasmid primase, P4 family [Christiangramia lutea]MCH4821760.1 phage/plasmid primase, P4 family [Christiangramia lutea]
MSNINNKIQMADLGVQPNKTLLEDLINEPEKLKKEKLEKSNVKLYILNNITEVDFRAEAGLEDNEKMLNRKHYIVLSIQLLKRKLIELNLGLLQKDGLVYLYNGEFWQGIKNHECANLLGKAALKMGVEYIEAKFFKFKEDLLKQFLSESHFEYGLKKDCTLINFKNGTFEITKDHQYLREFRKEDFLTYQLPFEYDENAEAPLFNSFINQVLPEIELRYTISEYLGSIFIKNNILKFEKALFLYGSGSNGKSVLFDIIKALIGNENFSSYSLDSLTKDKDSRAMISDKLLNYSSELSSNLESDFFKKLVSGEPVDARRLYCSSFMMEDYAKLMFNTNELPSNVEHNHGFFRRFMIIPFKVTIEEHQQDRQLSQKIIKSELPGIFNWVMDGLRRLLKNKAFTESEIIENQVDEFKRDSNSVLSFIDEEKYVKSMTDVTSLSDLYTNYKIYCSANNNSPCSKKKFSKRFEDDGFTKTRMKEGMFFNTIKEV